MEERKDVTVPMPKELSEAIEGELEYGDSKAGWIREAIRQRLEAEAESESDGADSTAKTDGGCDVHALAD